MFLFLFFLLFIFKTLNFTTIVFGRTTDTAVAFFESVLSGHLYALIFLLRGTVNHESLNQWGSNTIGRQ